MAFDGVSMDQIAAEAGVSKLTVYSHFGRQGQPVRGSGARALRTGHADPACSRTARTRGCERLTCIGLAFHAMIMTPRRSPGTASCARCRSPPATCRRCSGKLPAQRVQSSFTALLERRIARGEPDILIRRAPPRSSSPRGGRAACAEAVFGYCCGQPQESAEEHVAGVVELFCARLRHRPGASRRGGHERRRSALRCRNGW